MTTSLECIQPDAIEIGLAGVLATTLVLYEFYQKQYANNLGLPNLKIRLCEIAQHIGSPTDGRIGIIETIDQYSCI